MNLSAKSASPHYDECSTMRENTAPYRKHRHDTYTDKVATAANKTDRRMQLLKKDRIFEKRTEMVTFAQQVQNRS